MQEINMYRNGDRLGENWQEGKTLTECNLHLMECGFSDVTFRLYYKDANEKEDVVDIPALRTLCIARSSVFYAMFAGKLAQQLDDPVHEIHDDHVDPEAFKLMLRFIYSDDVTLTADNVLPILYLSHKYMVSTLTKRCLRFLEQHLTPDTAPVLLEQSMLYEEAELKEKTLVLIREQSPAVLASDDFLAISKQALGEILKLNLKIEKELTVFEACMKWAKNQCRKLKKSITGENVREILGENLYLIRFPTMSLTEFTDTVAPEDVLTSDDGYQVLRYIGSASKKPENLCFQTTSRLEAYIPRDIIIPAPYCTTKVHPTCRQSCTTFTSLSCTVPKPLHLKKIYVHRYTSARAHSIHHQVTITLKQNGNYLHESTCQTYVSRTEQLPWHYAIDIGDVHVESGALDLTIKLELSTGCGNSNPGYLHHSSPQTHKLADDYITITFAPVDENLLLGIGYVRNS